MPLQYIIYSFQVVKLWYFLLYRICFFLATTAVCMSVANDAIPIATRHARIITLYDMSILLWRHNGRDVISNHQPHDCLLNRSFADQRKHQSFASLAFLRAIHRRPVNSPHKWPVTRKMFPFDDVIMRNTETMITSWSGDVFCIAGPLWGESSRRR